MGDSLVCLIIKQDFGEEFAKVAELLLKHGELGLTEIVTLSELEFAKVKHIIIVLIKHNLVSFRVKEQDIKTEEPQVKDFRYTLVTGDVIHRIR